MEIYKTEDLKSYLDKLSKTFDVVRVVEPIDSKIHFFEGENKISAEVNCYDFWKSGRICENCISARAIKEDKRTSKIEYNDNGAYLVIATPFLLGDKKYSIEMILNINDIDTVTDLNKENSRMIEGVITNLKKNLLIDELTGVYNRRFINKNLPLNLELVKSKEIDKLAIIMVDIDDFKEINDKYGHLAGDVALKEISAAIKSNIRQDFDWVARYGGDEFIILLKNADEKVAKKVIEAIDAEVSNKIIIESNPQVKISASIGIHIVEGGNVNLEEVLEVVDRNLNKAKLSGKNRVIVS